jgi:outer membrane protein
MHRTLLLVFLFLFLFSSLSAQTSRVLNLQECVQIALENNLQIRRSNYNLQAAEISLMQSRMAMLPSFNVGSGYGKNFGRAINPVTNTFINRNSNTLNLQGAGTLTLFNGFRLSYATKQSLRDYQAGGQDLAKMKNDVTLNVVTLYTNVIFNKELLDNSRFQLESAQEQLGRIKKQVEAGALPKSNELNQEAQVATAEVTLINQENALNLSLLQLKQLLQIPGGEQIDVEIPSINTEDLVLENSPEQIFGIAKELMPEIKSAMLRVQSAGYGLRSVRGNFYPRLTFTAAAQSNYSSISNTARTTISGFELGSDPIGLVGPTSQPVYAYQPVYTVVSPDYNTRSQLSDNIFKTFNLQLNIPLFNGLQARAAVQRAVVTKKIAEVTRQESENTLRQSIETAYNDALAASKSYSASMKQVNARNEAYRMTKQRFEIGASNYVEYRISENDLFQAKSDLARAKYNFIFRKKLLDFYQGKSITL